jgi:hypothetical protein
MTLLRSPKAALKIAIVSDTTGPVGRRGTRRCESLANGIEGRHKMVTR